MHRGRRPSHRPRLLPHGPLPGTGPAQAALRLTSNHNSTTKTQRTRRTSLLGVVGQGVRNGVVFPSLTPSPLNPDPCPCRPSCLRGAVVVAVLRSEKGAPHEDPRFAHH